MRKEECDFSGFVIHPGHGRRYVPFAFISTKPILPFCRPKTLSLYLRKKNPRKLAWTRTFRRIHKKTTTDRVIKKRYQKEKRNPRAIVGASLAEIQEIRSKNTKVDRTAKGKAVRAEMAARKTAKKGETGKKAPVPKPSQK